MKKTIIYICGIINGRVSLKKEDAKLLTEFEGLYENSHSDKRINNKLHFAKRIDDSFSEEGVVREIYLAEFGYNV